VCAELASVVGGDGLHSVSHVWQQQPYGGFCGVCSVLSVCEFLHEDEVCGAFREGEYRPLAVLSDDGVHLPVAKARAVGLSGSVVYARAVGYVPHFRRAVGFSVAVVLHLVAAVRCEAARLITTYVLVNQLVGDGLALLLHITRHLFGRPVIVLYVPQRLPNDYLVLLAVGRGALAPRHGHILRLEPHVLAVLCAVPLQLAA